MDALSSAATLSAWSTELLLVNVEAVAVVDVKELGMLSSSLSPVDSEFEASVHRVRFVYPFVYIVSC